MAELCALAPTQGGVSHFYVGVTHTNSSDNTMPKDKEKKIALKKECALACLEHLFKFMPPSTRAGQRRVGSGWGFEPDP